MHKPTARSKYCSVIHVVLCVCVCVCVCVRACVRVCVFVTYEDTHLYNEMVMT